MWTHQLVPVSQHERDADNTANWDGQLMAMKRAVKAIVDAKIEAMHKATEARMDKTDEKLSAILEALGEVKAAQNQAPAATSLNASPAPLPPLRGTAPLPPLNTSSALRR